MVVIVSRKTILSISFGNLSMCKILIRLWRRGRRKKVMVGRKKRKIKIVRQDVNKGGFQLSYRECLIKYCFND